MVTTPHFQDNSGSMTPGAVATQLATNVTSYVKAPFQGYVKLYHEDFNPAAPHPPMATATFGTAGNFMNANGPRELALCLSYYAAQTTKRFRGRLYIPWLLTGSSSDSRVISSTGRDRVGALAQVWADIGGVDVDWSVYSKEDNVAHKVTDWWVDEGWDTVRSRTLKALARTKGTTSG